MPLTLILLTRPQLTPFAVGAWLILKQLTRWKPSGLFEPRFLEIKPH